MPCSVSDSGMIVLQANGNMLAGSLEGHAASFRNLNLGRIIRMRNLLGWLEFRLAQIIFNYLAVA